MQIPGSLKEYILVAQDVVRVEVFRRPDGVGHWSHEVSTAGQTLLVHGQAIAVDDIYNK
jgi:hypothetical protein